MPLALKPILIVLAVLATAWLGMRVVNSVYLQPRAALVKQISDLTAEVGRERAAQEDARNVNRRLQGFVERTLGPNLETADHRLRSRLNRLCEQARLQGVTVGTEGSGRERRSPAAAVFRSSAQKTLHDEIDFVELQGSISGGGTLEDVVRLISAIESEPWIKRIDSVELTPRDNGARVALSLHLTTLFLPGREPKTEQPQPKVGEVDARYASLVRENPFRVPPPPKPTPPAPPAVAAGPPPPPPFPFNEWAVTGVALGPSGAEAWLLHKPNGETRVLTVGQALDAAVFAGASGDVAEFTFGQQRFTVAVGATMDQRRPEGLH